MITDMATLTSKALENLAERIATEVKNSLDYCEGTFVKVCTGTMKGVQVYTESGYISGLAVECVQSIVGLYVELYGDWIFYGVDYDEQLKKPCINIRMLSV